MHSKVSSCLNIFFDPKQKIPLTPKIVTSYVPALLL